MATLLAPPPGATAFDTVAWVSWLVQMQRLYAEANLSQFAQIPPPPELSPYLKSDGKQVSWEWIKWLINVRRGLNVVLADADVVIDCINSGGGGIPVPSGAGDLQTGSRTIAVADSDYVTLLEKTTPHAIFGNLIVTRSVNGTGGQVVSYRCYVNDILVDERSITWPVDAVNQRCAKLVVRAPGSVAVAGTSETGTGGDTFPATQHEFGTATVNSTSDLRGIVQSPFLMNPRKIRIEMKGVTISVSSTYTAQFYAYPCANGGDYWSGLVRSYRADRTKPQNTAADSDYVELLSITGPGQLLSPAFVVRGPSAGSGQITPASYKSVIDGFDMRSMTSAGGSAAQNYVLEGHGPIRSPAFNNAATPEFRQADFWTHHPGPKFNSSFKVYTQMGSTGAGQTISHRVEVLVGFF